jgi:hypothetical protein
MHINEVIVVYTTSGNNAALRQTGVSECDSIAISVIPGPDELDRNCNPSAACAA